MPSYVALLRGITPTNPKHRNESLRSVCEDLGFTHVATVISSGNIVFRTERTDTEAMETELEQAWQDQLDFESRTILRSRSDFEALVDLAPFEDRQHGPATYLLVTFAKQALHVPFALPRRPDGHEFEVLAATESELFTVSDTTAEKTPDVMSWIERTFGKDVSSRTWLTVHRILKKMA